MIDDDQDPRAWRVAIALALESGLAWAEWASGGPSCSHPFASRFREESGILRCTRCGGDVNAMPVPVLAPWDDDAYQVYCGLRNVEPGPMPALSWSDLEDSGIEWSVMMEDFDHDDGTVTRDVVIGLGVGNAEATYSCENGWELNGRRILVDDVSVLLRLVTAASKAMKTC